VIAGITGVILAGGQSRRFGANKALALLAGRRLIEHPAGVLSGLFAQRLLVTNTPEQYDFLGWPMIADRFPGAGPLAGIHAALCEAEDERIFVTACDMPTLCPETIHFLCACPSGWDAVVPWLHDGPEPLCAVYAKSALPALVESLRQGVFQVQAVLARLRTRMVSKSELPPDAAGPGRFVNVNTPADLAVLAKEPPPKDPLT